ncbi:MAG: putative 4-mercaptohistidine N1-methyltransferase [Opitutales bacterium]
MSENPYESQELLAQYLLFHYGTAREVLPWPMGPSDALDYAVRAVSEPLADYAVPANARALDIGCAVGRSSFELSKSCAEVIGIDFAQSFIDAAERIRTTGEHPYAYTVEGKITAEANAKTPEGTHSERIKFQQGDAMDLPDDLGDFDIVLAANLICRLPDPMKFLERLPSLIKPGGLLILNTPLTWLEEFTPEINWIGGTPESGETLPGLKKILDTDFELKKSVNMPFFIREHARKYQWSVAQSSRWIRK